MYSKLYRTIFDGTLYGQFEALTVFMAMLALSNQHGEVDAAPAKIAGCLGTSLDFVLKGIKQLESPDPHSRTPALEGRRLIPLLDDEGNDRAFGWTIVNYAKYRAIRNEEERREYKRNWDREHRSKSRNPTKSDQPDTTRPHTEADTEVEESKALLGKPNGVRAEETKRLKAEAVEILAFLNLKANRAYQPVPANTDLIVARFKEGVTSTQLKQVIVRKCRDWLVDEKMTTYLRPATLFNRTNCAQYVGELVPLMEAE